MQDTLHGLCFMKCKVNKCEHHVSFSWNKETLQLILIISLNESFLISEASDPGSRIIAAIFIESCQGVASTHTYLRFASAYGQADESLQYDNVAYQHAAVYLLRFRSWIDVVVESFSLTYETNQ